MTLQEDFVLARKLLRKAKKPLMFYDTDTDGTTSYFQLKNKFPKIVGYPFRYREGDRLEEFLQKLDYDPDLIVVFDVPVLTKDFFEAFKDKKIIWADHHPSNDKKLIAKYDVHHINPLNYSKKENHAASYLAYKVANTKKNLFYAALGSVADFYLLDVVIDLYKYSKKEFNLLFELDDKTRKELFTFIKSYDPFDKRVNKKRVQWVTYLWYDAKLIRYKNFFDTVHKNKYDLVLEGIEKARSLKPKQLLTSLKAGAEFPFDHYADLMSEYRKVYDKAIKVEQGKLYFFEYESKYGFTKTLSEEMKYRCTNSDVVAIAFKKPGKDYWQLSMRSSKTDLTQLAKKLTRGLEGNGGGHKVAAGVRVHDQDYNTLKERLFNIKF